MTSIIMRLITGARPDKDDATAIAIVTTIAGCFLSVLLFISASSCIHAFLGEMSVQRSHANMWAMMHLWYDAEWHGVWATIALASATSTSFRIAAWAVGKLEQHRKSTGGKA